MRSEGILGFLVGVGSSVVASLLIVAFLKGKSALAILGSHYRLAAKLRHAGVEEIRLTRSEFHEPLTSFFGKARISLEIISVSLKATANIYNLVDLFVRPLERNASLTITISLLQPSSSATSIMAKSLGIDRADLDRDIRSTARALINLRTSMEQSMQRRLLLLFHDSLPFGNAILIDSTPDSGIMQIETRLHNGSRAESFSFRLKGPGEFYRRNYTSWKKLIEESVPITEEILNGNP